jgi:hypothetical protein
MLMLSGLPGGFWGLNKGKVFGVFACAALWVFVFGDGLVFLVVYLWCPCAGRHLLFGLSLIS